MAGIPCGAPAHMGDLPHHRRTMRSHTIGQPCELRNDAVIAFVELAKDRRAVGRDLGQPANDRQANAALGLFRVI